MQTTDQLPPPPPPPSPAAAPPPVRRLYRAPAPERAIGGVAAGLAEYLDVPVALVRVAFIVLAVLNGIGIIAYLACLLLIPERPGGVPRSDRAPDRSSFEGATTIVGVGLLVIAGSIVLDGLGVGSTSLAWAFGLIALGVVLFRRAEGRSDGEGLPAAPGAGYRGPGGADVTRPLATTGGDPADSSGRTSMSLQAGDPGPSTDTSDRRARSPLGRLGVAASLIATGLVLGLDQLGVLALTGAQVAAVALLVLGLVLLVSAFVGRARILVVPILVLAPLVGALEVVEGAGAVEAGERVVAPTGLLADDQVLRHGVGSFTVDLRDADLGGRDVRIEAGMGMGELLVTVPADVDVVATGRAGVGTVDVLGAMAEGVGPSRTTTASGETTDVGAADGGTLRLEASVGFGEVRVERAPPASGGSATSSAAAPALTPFALSPRSPEVSS